MTTQGKTRQVKARQDKTRQGKSRQDKEDTFIEATTSVLRYCNSK
jgi:hypothetical protein